MIEYMPSSYYPWVLVGRSFFGLVGDGLYSVQGIILSVYCPDNYEFMVSLVWSSGYLADAMGSLISTLTYDSTNSVSTPFFIASGVCGLSFLSGIILVLLMKKESRRKEKEK